MAQALSQLDSSSWQQEQGGWQEVEGEALQHDPQQSQRPQEEEEVPQQSSLEGRAEDQEASQPTPRVLQKTKADRFYQPEPESYFSGVTPEMAVNALQVLFESMSFADIARLFDSIVGFSSGSPPTILTASAGANTMNSATPAINWGTPAINSETPAINSGASGSQQANTKGSLWSAGVVESIWGEATQEQPAQPL